MPKSRGFGFLEDSDKRLFLNPDTKEIVMAIVKLAKKGFSAERIATEMSRSNYLSPSGLEHWSGQTCWSIYKRYLKMTENH